jgi:hypothetical protein
MNFRDLTSSRGLAFLFAVFCIFGYMLPSVTGLFVANRGVQVDVDAKIESGRIVELYVNGYRNAPLTVPITTGVRRTYTFSHILENVNFLRVDLGKISGAAVEVYGITVSVDGKLAKYYGPDVIYQWAQSQPDMMEGGTRIDGDHVIYVQKVYGPSLITYDVFAGGIAAALQWLLPQDRNGIVLTFWAAFLVVIALARTPYRVRAQTLLILLGVPVASMLAVRIAYRFANWPDPVDQAIGRAGFIGLSLVPNRVVALTVLAAALSMSVFFVLVTRRIDRQNSGAAPAAAVETPYFYDRFRLLRVFAIALTVIIIASLFFAQVYDRITNLNLPFTNDWDANNVNLWRYLIYKGLRPLQDFYYPYGGTWTFALPAPWGELSEASMKAAVYITCFLALVRVCGVIPAVIILYVVLVSDRIQLMWAPWRYLLGVNVALAYVAIGKHRDRFRPGHLLFAVAFSLSAFFEPLMIVYAAPAIVAMLTLDFFQRKILLDRAFFWRLVTEFTLPLTYLVVYFTLISNLGELRGLATFILTLGPHAYSSAAPTDLAAAVQWPFGVGLLLLAMPSTLIGVGLYRRLSGCSTAPVIDDVLIALGIVGFLYFQKHLVRPVDWQFVTPTLLAMLIWLVSDPAFRRTRIAVVGGAAAGMLFWSLNLTGAPGSVLRQAIAAPLSAAKSIYAVINSPEIVTDARDNSYSAERFSAFPSFSSVAARLRNLGNGQILQPIFVIGDAPMLYAFLHQTPPFNTDEYTTSPMFEQRQMIDWLNANRPRFAVWNASDLNFDGVPRVVRLPLLYALYGSTFVPSDVVGQFVILRRRNDGEAPSLAWWRGRLGATIDFGGLLRRSSFERLSDCKDTLSLERCTPFLDITVPAELRNQPHLAITVAVGDLPFKVEFVPSATIGTYHVRLDRLWFWDAAHVAGLPFHIVGAESPGVTVTFSTKEPDDRHLY